MSWWRAMIACIALAMAGCNRGDGLEEQLAAIDWTEVGGPIDAPRPDLRIGDLVPCADHLAEYQLEIRAMRDGECWYQQRRAFRRYTIPKDGTEDDVNPSQELLVCATLANGFASGSYECFRLAKDHVMVRINWRVSRETSTAFSADITAVLGHSGSADAGNGNSLEWNFQTLR